MHHFYQSKEITHPVGKGISWDSEIVFRKSPHLEDIKKAKRAAINKILFTLARSCEPLHMLCTVYTDLWYLLYCVTHLLFGPT